MTRTTATATPETNNKNKAAKTGVEHTIARRSTLLPADMLRLGLVGLKAKPVRTALSALGVTIGVAAMVAVLGISASSQAKLQATLAELGTNLFTVEASQTMSGDDTLLPEHAHGRLDRLNGAESSAAIAQLPEVSVYRNPHVDPSHNGGISVSAAGTELTAVVAGNVAERGYQRATKHSAQSDDGQAARRHFARRRGVDGRHECQGDRHS